MYAPTDCPPVIAINNRSVSGRTGLPAAAVADSNVTIRSIETMHATIILLYFVADCSHAITAAFCIFYEEFAVTSKRFVQLRRLLFRTDFSWYPVTVNGFSG